ncbi:MAG TPA: carbohydrate ABC transporter permease, partial [Aggregatilineales bacterium]|nr:carbohydrate ABC transporter permease [Aggregatilineales bacterium]
MPDYYRISLQSVKYAILITIALIILAPLVSNVLGSVRTTPEVVRQPFGLPTRGIQWENYTSILDDPAFWQSFRASIFITVMTTTLTVSLSSMLAFLFARIEFFGRNLLFNFFTLGLMFPIVIAILPVFIRVRELGLINSYWGVILPLVAFGIPGSTIILRSFFRAIPNELEDAAYIDGCTIIGFFRHILIPLARPA